MSLLLEALKKAELAKQVAKAEAPPEPEPAPSEPDTRRVITREKLPDITQSLRILTDDLPSSDAKAAETAAERPESSPPEKEAFGSAAQPAHSTNEFGRAAGARRPNSFFR